jgi:glucose-1-phosphate thymidylyltransferase
MTSTQGIILTGGLGTRMAPHSTYFNKGLYPINNKFVIDYSLETLKDCGVKDLIVILGGSHFSQIVDLLKDGKDYNFNSIVYVYQNKPSGISQAINLCKDLITSDNFTVILGDNVFEQKITFNSDEQYAAQVVLTKHKELQRFGVLSVKNNKIVKLEEKPLTLDPSVSQYAITGLYRFDREYFNFFKHTKPSARGEYEIVDIIRMYQEEGSLGWIETKKLWADCGTHDAARNISNYFNNKNLKP